MAGSDLKDRKKAMAVSKENPYPRYTEKLDHVEPNIKSILLKAGVPEDKLIEHITEIVSTTSIRLPLDDSAHGCTVEGTGLGNTSIPLHSITTLPEYPEVLERVKDGQRFLDLACCFGQILRKMNFDGAPASNLYGSDLRQDFIELGFDLFLDKSTFGAKFLVADAFETDTELTELEGTIDIIHSSSFFHLFDRETQVKLGKRIVSLLKPEKGSLLFGRQVGWLDRREKPHPNESNRVIHRHNPETWADLWEQIGNETGTQWKTGSEMLASGTEVENTRMHRFTVRRL
ncbi:MAG: hypothetical protein M1820_006554 [Bogoriella megaspora]|nr:MAG: hypothetical protein M1820_006554 [Bogoriella megaspora]